MKQIAIQTDDGTCPAYTFEPAGGAGGKALPGVLLFMDGIGMRPALYPIAQRIADHGYFVLMPDVFYRAGAYQAPDPKELFGNPEAGKAWFGKMFQQAQPALVMKDVKAYLAVLDAQPGVAHGAYATTGYCMGGRLAIIAAGTYPDRFAAAAAFHPGGMATDDPSSPHLLAPKITARVLVAGAQDDPSFPDAQKEKLAAAFAAAGTNAKVETYPAKHGWVPSDTPVHDAAQAERHFQATFELFDRALR